jgi:uncharacterized LabA/DUF88 family protein
MTNIAIFADVANLYYCIGRKYDGRKLDYERLYNRASEYGLVQRAFAYGTQISSEANNFITALRRLGWTPKYKQPKMSDTPGEERKVIRKADWDVGIAMDAVRMSDKVGVIMLCSSDPDLVPLVEWIKEQGIRCVVLACGIARELKDVADQYYEIEPDLLEPLRDVA